MIRSALQSVLPSSFASSSSSSSSVASTNHRIVRAAAHPNPSLYDVVDEEKMLSESTFPIKPNELIELTKENLRKGFANIDLSEDFEFIGPVVGPLSKDTFVNAVAGFELAGRFPRHEVAVSSFQSRSV